MYFLNENVLHLTKKYKPCFLTRIIDLLSLLSVNSHIGVCLCENIMFGQIGSHVGAAVHFFGVSSLLSESIHMYMYILKPNNKTNGLERKATLNICFGKTETSAQAGTGLRRAALLFLYPLESFNRGKLRISRLFCKVNSLNIA